MKTLIVYSTKHGTTGICAEMLSKKLAGEIVLHNLKDGAVQDMSGYDNIVIGGSIYVGKIQKEVSAFCNDNLKLLKGKKIGLFICCLFKENAQLQLDGAFPAELASIAAARENFGGEMRFSSMNFAEKTLTRMIMKTVAKNDPVLGTADLRKDVSLIIYENIDNFAQKMNNN